MRFGSVARKALWTVVLFTTFYWIASAQAQTKPRINILHTSDLHSHFTNRQSDRALGGFARLKSKIDQVRNERGPSLLLDSGDWSEGTIFFTLGSGVQTQRILQKFNYDAMVLGNHDWLVGPNQMYDSFVQANFKTPVLSANLNFKDLSPQVPLRNFIKPYLVKKINGVKVGIIGLSTFQLIYDHYFDPVTVTDPIRPAIEAATYLKMVEGCQVIIALTHLGITQDKLVAQSVPFLDLILGGHNHTLFKKPVYVGNVPIVHIGEWGEYLGDYALELQPNGGTKLVRHEIHQVDFTTKEDPEIRDLVSDSIQAIEQRLGGPVFSDQVAFSEVELQVSHQPLSNDVMGQWSVDAMRAAVRTDIAVDSPLFASAQLKRGAINSADIFDLFPHVYVERDRKAWTIHTYEVTGYTLRALLALLVKFNLPLNLSNVEMVVDMNNKDVIEEVLIGGKPLSWIKSYSIASNSAILELFKQLKSTGIPIGPVTWKDTGIEIWRLVRDDLMKRSPILISNLNFKPRVRTKAPDFAISTEFLKFVDTNNSVQVVVKVFNAGKTKAKTPTTTVRVDNTPLDSLDDNWSSYEATSIGPLKAEMAPGESIEMTLEWPISNAAQGVTSYPIEITISSTPGEQNLSNNRLKSQLQVLTLID